MQPDRINYRVYLLAQKPGIIGKVDATVLQDKRTEIDVISNPNAKMHPKNGFAFYPERETIPLNQTDKVSLIVDENVKNSNAEILVFSSSNNVECVHHKMKIEGKNLKKISPYHNVYELKIPLIGKKLGVKSVVTAVAGNKQAKVQVEVVTILHKATHGLFKDLKIEEHRQVQDIAFERDGILIVNKAHPVIRAYTLASNYMKAEKYQTLIAHIFAELISKAIVDYKKKEGKLAFIDPTNPENVVDTLNLEYRDIYYQHGFKFVGMISKLLEKEWSEHASSSSSTSSEET